MSENVNLYNGDKVKGVLLDPPRAASDAKFAEYLTKNFHPLQLFISPPCQPFAVRPWWQSVKLRWFLRGVAVGMFWSSLVWAFV